MSPSSHPDLSPSEWATIERELHHRQAHPLYQYCTTRDGKMPEEKDWEVNPEVVNGPIRHWRRLITGTVPRYTDEVIEQIRQLAVGYEIHPWFEFERREVIFKGRIEPDEQLTIDYFLHTYVLGEFPVKNQPTDWAMNRLHVSGGFNISAYAGHFWLYRRRATHL